jgi:hypothetical protein
VTHDQAQAESDRFGREHPDRASHIWMPRASAGGDWLVARIAVPAGMDRTRFKATVEAKPRPQTADDPRPAGMQNIPPFGAGV